MLFILSLIFYTAASAPSGSFPNARYIKDVYGVYLLPIAADSKIAPALQSYIDFEYSICIPEEKSDEDKKIQVLYFWPHRIVELKCFCNDEQLLNGEPKIWRYMPFSNRGLFTRSWFNKSNFINLKDRLHNMMYHYHHQSNLITGSRLAPTFVQQNGLLVISHAGLEVQGIYNCYDSTTFENVEWVYVLIAMTPQVMLPCYALWNEVGDEEKNHRKRVFEPSRRHCPQLELSFPLMIGRFAFPYEQWHHAFLPIKPNFEEQEDYVVHKDWTIGIDLEIFIQWSAWTPCSACAPYRGLQTREGHCHMKIKEGKEDIGSASKHMDKSKYLFGLGIQIVLNSTVGINASDEKIYLLRSKESNLRILSNLLNSGVFPDGIPIHSGLLVDVFCEKPHSRVDYDCLLEYMITMVTLLENSYIRKSVCFSRAPWNILHTTKIDDMIRQFTEVPKYKPDFTIVGGYYIEIRECQASCN